jgi:hypothetical protein
MALYNSSWESKMGVVQLDPRVRLASSPVERTVCFKITKGFGYNSYYGTKQ